MSAPREIPSDLGWALFLLPGLLLLPPIAEAAPAPLTTIQEVNAEFGYVGGATTTLDDADLGSIDAWRTELSYVVSPQLNRRLFLRTGVQWRRYAFGVPGGVALPEELQQVNALLGFDWQASDKWLLRAEIQPGVFSDFQEITWDDVTAPVVVGGVYVTNANLQWMAGLRVVPRSAYPVIPAVGVRWKFAPEWTLNFFLPDPRVQYDINDRLKAYLGMSFRLGTFTLGDRFGDDHQQPDLNGVEVDYFEMLLGPGVSWKIRPNLTLDLNAGCLAFRAFAFNTDRDLVAQSEPAPYVQLMCLWVF